jgi:hypothetical protein
LLNTPKITAQIGVSLPPSCMAEVAQSVWLGSGEDWIGMR